MRKFFLSMLAAMIAGVSVNAADEAEVKLPPKDKFFIFVLAGQSNMAGRGIVEDADKKPDANVFMLTKDGKWVPAVDPVHFDKKEAGVGLCRTFAAAVAAKNPGVVIGLVPTACGGSPISTWTPGGYHDQTKSNPYDDSIKRAKLAMEAGTLKAILWHQGEGDCGKAASAVYEEKLTELIGRFRTELNAPNVPVIIGQLGQFKPWGEYVKAVNQAQINVSEKVSNCAFVKSDGLTCNKDNIHFDAASQKEFGKRYAEAYFKLTEKAK